MSQYKLNVKTRSGFHIKPCSEIAHLTRKLEHQYLGLTIQLYYLKENKKTKDDRTIKANASSLIDILKMAIRKGESIEVIVSGDYSIDILRECALDIGYILETRF